MIRVEAILKEAKRSGDRQLSRDLRMAALNVIRKEAGADQHGIFQHFQGDVINYNTREHYHAERGGELPSSKLYGIGPEHEDTKGEIHEPARSLSTRYSPDRVGVSARRVEDGVYQDPYTNKTYNWNEGFRTEDGEEFPPGAVALQTDIFYR